MATNPSSSNQRSYRPFSSYLPSEFFNRSFDLNGNLNNLEIISPKSFDPLNPSVDEKWSGKTGDAEKFNSYYDYYFSGEDVKVYIDGLFDAGSELDLASFSFLIKQEKQPLYGFWSYNYDVMMVGTRIISGEFSIFTRYPGRMRDLLSKAADQRAKAFVEGKNSKRVQSKLLGNSESQEDEKNIQKYWANNKLDRVSYDERRQCQKHILRTSSF